MTDPAHQPLRDLDLGEVLDGLRRGDTVAVNRVFNDMQPRLLRFLRATEPRMADDICGEVWAAVAAGIDRFSGDLGGLRAWMFSIARRRLADHRRRAARRRTDVADEAVFDDAQATDMPDLEVLDRLSGQEAADLVKRLLPPDQAEVVLLRVLAELDVDDVAEIVGRTANWVRVTQHRGLRRLAERLPNQRPAVPVIPTPPTAI